MIDVAPGSGKPTPAAGQIWVRTDGDCAGVRYTLLRRNDGRLWGGEGWVCRRHEDGTEAFWADERFSVGDLEYMGEQTIAKRYAWNVEAAQATLERKIKALASQLREEVVVPLCLERRLDYEAGVSRMLFFGEHEGKVVRIGVEHVTRGDYGGAFDYLGPIFDALDVWAGPGANDFLGLFVRDVKGRS